MEEMENIFGNLLAILTDFANDYGVSIKGKIEVCNEAKDFNERKTIDRGIDVYTGKITNKK